MENHRYLRGGTWISLGFHEAFHRSIASEVTDVRSGRGPRGPRGPSWRLWRDSLLHSTDRLICSAGDILIIYFILNSSFRIRKDGIMDYPHGLSNIIHMRQLTKQPGSSTNSLCWGLSDAVNLQELLVGTGEVSRLTADSGMVKKWLTKLLFTIIIYIYNNI